MAQKKNPGSASTLHGTGKHTPAVSGAAYHQKKRPDIEVIWDACRKAQDAAASREAEADAKLKSAALSLDFAQNESGRWEKECPNCLRTVALFTTQQGNVHASGSCSSVPSIQQWLCDRGFQS
jgi:hypothetical protein